MKKNIITSIILLLTTSVSLAETSFSIKVPSPTKIESSNTEQTGGDSDGSVDLGGIGGGSSTPVQITGNVCKLVINNMNYETTETFEFYSLKNISFFDDNDQEFNFGIILSSTDKSLYGNGANIPDAYAIFENGSITSSRTYVNNYIGDGYMPYLALRQYHSINNSAYEYWAAGGSGSQQSITIELNSGYDVKYISYQNEVHTNISSTPKRVRGFTQADFNFYDCNDQLIATKRTNDDFIFDVHGIKSSDSYKILNLF